MKHLLCLYLVGSLTASLYAAHTMNLQQCIDSALAYNTDLKRKVTAYESRRLNYQQSLYNLSPTLNGNIGQNWSFGRSLDASNVSERRDASNTDIGLSASLTLWDGLKMKFQIDEAKARMQASSSDQETVEKDLCMNVTVMYLQVLLNKELLKVAEHQCENSRHQLEHIQGKVDAHRLAEGDIYEYQAQVALREQDRVQAENTLRLSLLDLAQAIDLVDLENFDIVVPDESELQARLLPNNQQVYESALLHRPEIHAMQYNIQAEEAALRSAKAAYSPSIALTASTGSNYYNLFGKGNASFGQQMSDNFTTNVGFRMQIPIYNQMKTTTALRQARLNVKDRQLELELTKKDLRKKIDQAYYNAVAAQAKEKATEMAEVSATEAYRYAQQKSDAGRASAYDLQNAQNNYIKAASDRLQAKYDYLFRLKVLEYYME